MAPRSLRCSGKETWMDKVKAFLTSKAGLALVAAVVAALTYYSPEAVEIVQKIVAALTGGGAQ